MRRLIACLALSVLGCLLLILSHVEAAESALLMLCVSIQAIAGGYIWRVVMRKPVSLPEVVGGGLAVGSAGAALLAAIASLLPLSSALRPWAWALMPLLTVILWLLRRLSGRTLPASPTPR